MLRKIRDYRMQKKVEKWNRLLAQENRAGLRREKEFHYQDSNVHSFTSGMRDIQRKGIDGYYSLCNCPIHLAACDIPTTNNCSKFNRNELERSDSRS